MKQRIVVVCALMGLALTAGPLAAYEIEGIRLDEKISLGQGSPQVVLNGAGVRHKMVFIKVYVGALYLTGKKTETDEVIKDSGPKRVAMHLLRELSPDQLLSALNEGLKNNHTPEQLVALEAQIRQLESIFGTVKAAKAGDVILIDYVPGTGTRITINGEAKGIIPGAEFNKALLRVWLGGSPADADLKKAMLGGG